ncbi:MAG: hypothetical protein ACJ77B_05160, partial [Chloroflexota bacterium]
ASGVLVDVEFGLEPIRRANAVAPGVGLIVAADVLTQRPGGPVESTDVDEDVLNDDAIAGIADAYKLLVIWRAGSGADDRRRTVSTFVDACRRVGKPAIVEGIVRGDDGETLDGERHVEAVVAAAHELAPLGADLYKAEVPTLGAATDDVIAEHSRRLTGALDCPWVVLSNGTPGDRFADAAVAACRGGASGFLAGRAIWSASIHAPDVSRDLETAAAARLAGLATRIDGIARPWWAAPAGERR